MRKGASKPDISTRAAFVQTLLNARSIGYSASASGTYLGGNLFPRLGVWDRIKDKTRRILSERVAAVVARGALEIGFQQVSEILPIHGADFVGEIPDEPQEVTLFWGDYDIGAESKRGAPAARRHFVACGCARGRRQPGSIPVALDRVPARAQYPVLSPARPRV